MEKLAEESELHRNFLLPPLPIQQASQQYEANFRATMGIVGSEVKNSIDPLVNFQGLNKNCFKRILIAQE